MLTMMIFRKIPKNPSCKIFKKKSLKKTTCIDPTMSRKILTLIKGKNPGVEGRRHYQEFFENPYVEDQ